MATAVMVESLREISMVLLDERVSRGELKAACIELFQMLSGVAEEEAISLATADTPLANGLAVSPALAAACVDDALRTAMYARGLKAAVEEAHRRFPGTCIEVVYAGSGPFASLALPVMAVSSPDDVRFTLIDIHPQSLRCADAVLSHFGLSAFVRRMVAGDATMYEHPSDLPLHVIVSETLQEALQAEPQVPITRQLTPQLTPGGLLVPAEITVDLMLMERQIFTGLDGAPPIPVARLMTLDKSFAELRERDGVIPLVELQMPHVSERFMLAYVLEIGVFGPFRLAGRDCCLTFPVPIRELQDVSEGETISFGYQLGSRPGFVFKRES